MHTSVDLQKEIAAARKRVAQLEQAATRLLTSPSAEDDPKEDWLNGSAEIAEFLGPGWTPKRVCHAHKKNKFKGAVWKMGRRTMIGSRRKLRALPELLSKTP